MNWFKRIFLNERIILVVILLNAIVLYLHLDGLPWQWLQVVDYICTIIFLIEMLVKWSEIGFRDYWHDAWNRMDGVVVILSSPSLILPFIDISSSAMNTLIIFRLIRVIKFLRVLHFFPNFSKLAEGFSRAMRQTWAVLLSFAVFVIVFALIDCSLFSEVSPQYFGTPGDAIYSVFQLFSVEGWYEIPNSITGSIPTYTNIVRLFFCAQLLGGGIIGMSFINSVFVDAMAEDNNDDVKEQLRQMEEKIDRLTKMIEQK